MGDRIMRADWPDKELVQVKVLSGEDKYGPMGSSWGIFNFGLTCGAARTEAYAYDDIPEEVLKVIDALPGYRPYPQFAWFDVPPPGQSGRGTPNQYGVWLPSFWGYTEDKAKIVRVEVGCDHEYRIHNERNCYREGTCNKCGYHWICDSGD